MTENQLKLKDLQEQQRSNREKEKLERSKQKVQKDLGEKGLVKDIVVGMTGAAVKPVSSVIGAINDPSWYNMSKESVKAVANISYATPMGSASNALPYEGISSGAMTRTHRQITNLMRLNLVPTIAMGGKSSTSAANIAARNIYSFVRYANSGGRNYEPADLMMYLLSMDSAYIIYATLIRAYRICNNRNPQNWYYPKRIIEALGFDYKDFISNLSEIRQYIRILRTRLSAYYVPAVLPYYSRHIWLASNIFSESPLVKANLYIPNFSVLYKWNYDTQNGTYLEPHSTVLYSSTDNTEVAYWKWADIRDQVYEPIIEALANETDVGIISGDILRAYGDSKVFHLEEVDLESPLPITFSQEVLSQINSATVVGNCNPVIRQDAATGLIYMSTLAGNQFVEGLHAYNLTFGGNINSLLKDYTILNMYKDDVSPDDNMVASRLAVTYRAGSLTIGEATIKTQLLTKYGTEFIATIDLFGFRGDDQTVTPRNYAHLNDCMIMSATDGKEGIYAEALAAFDWAPRIRIFTTNDPLDAVQNALIVYDNFDVANFAIVDENTLGRMHEVASYSQFGVPATQLMAAPRK